MTNKAETGKTFKTFRDLKTIPKKSDTPPNLPSISSISSVASISSKTSRTRIPSNTSKSSSTSTAKKQETSPARDFQKIPNSVTRDALPQGTFRGKSKHVYDYLWSVSRGAFTPTRFVKKSRREIKQGSGIGSMVTVDAALDHLEAIGLIKVSHAVGSLSGNQYEIFAPDEIDLTNTSISSLPSISSPTQKMDILDYPESSITRVTQIKENNATYNDAKTIFKTLNLIDDDSPLTNALEMLNEAAKRATGRDLTRKDFEGLKEIVEIIIAETDLARTRTHSVSVYLKLASENLRRRLYSKPRPEKGKSDKQSNWAKVGEFDPGLDLPIEKIELEPLTEETRQNALVILRGMLRNNTLDDLQSLSQHYTPEDWKWLTEQLKNESR